MSELFSEAELNYLSAEIDRQLIELREPIAFGTMKSAKPEPTQSAPKQMQEIAQLTGEPPENFLRKFGRAAKADLCEEGGMLHQQWKRWGDLNNRDTVEKFGAVLTTLGITGEVLPLVAIAIVVIVLHIGVKAFCEEYSRESQA